MTHRSIPQRELRNEIARVLRDAGAGAEFVVTVRGRPVARLGPVSQAAEPTRDVNLDALREILSATPVDDGLAAAIREMRDAEEPATGPWPNG